MTRPWIRLSIGLVVLTWLAWPAHADEADILAWKLAMTTYTESLQGASAAGLCAGINGTCGRLDEQTEHMASAKGRAVQILGACRSGKPTKAVQFAAAARTSFLHHVGLAWLYVRRGDLPWALYLQHMGDAAVPDPRAYPTMTGFKRAMEAFVRARFDPLAPPEANAVWGYGQVLSWLDPDMGPCL